MTYQDQNSSILFATATSLRYANICLEWYDRNLLKNDAFQGKCLNMKHGMKCFFLYRTWPTQVVLATKVAQTSVMSSLWISSKSEFKMDVTRSGIGLKAEQQLAEIYQKVILTTFRMDAQMHCQSGSGVLVQCCQVYCRLKGLIYYYLPQSLACHEHQPEIPAGRHARLRFAVWRPTTLFPARLSWVVHHFLESCRIIHRAHKCH